MLCRKVRSTGGINRYNRYIETIQVLRVPVPHIAALTILKGLRQQSNPTRKSLPYFPKLILGQNCKFSKLNLKNVLYLHELLKPKNKQH